ncbi:hypothetical protein SBRCBS47491_008219, partial [Sporothrix bragantina]
MSSHGHPASPCSPCSPCANPELFQNAIRWIPESHVKEAAGSEKSGTNAIKNQQEGVTQKPAPNAGSNISRGSS